MSDRRTQALKRAAAAGDADAAIELERAKARASVVAVSEAEPLDLPGWHHVELTLPGGKPEWLTVSREPDRHHDHEAR